jgi:hypothetical protein
MFLRLLPLAALLSMLISCATPPRGTFLPSAVPPPPDYAQAENWAALPTKTDLADRTPGDSLTDRQDQAAVDVFYLHPTIYSGSAPEHAWNADVRDDKLNEAVDESAILNQASIFNGAGRVYAPRYRQAHLRVFYGADTSTKNRALDTAYADVRAAFDHYLREWNDGRPFIIAAHSQGTIHAARLIQDRIDGQPRQDQLVAAYLVGIAVPRAAFETIPLCTGPAQTGCFVSWRTVRDDFEPPARKDSTDIAVVNPLVWTTTTDHIPPLFHQGAVLRNYEKGPLPQLVWTEIRGAYLYTNRPKFFGDIFFTRKNYHIADYNLFWLDVRENARLRARNFLDGR